MKHQPLAQFLATAVPVDVRPAMSRHQRLRRWAELLAREDERLLRPFSFVEFYAPAERRRLHVEGSPLSVALADPVLREEGLKGDRLGDGQDFFGLNDRDTHYLLCDCHWHGRMTGKAAAKRLRRLSSRNPVNRLLVALQTH